MFDATEFEMPIVLYHGPARLHVGDESVDGLGQLRFDWRPTPSVNWFFAGDAVPHHVFVSDPSSEWLEPLGDTDPRVHVAVASWSAEQHRDHHYSSSGTQPYESVIGRADGFVCVETLVLNFVNQVHKNRPTVDVAVGDWRLTVERTPDTDDTLAALRDSGGYGRTHVARVTRIDGAPFGFEDAEPVVDAAWLIMSFAVGGHVGLALPVGLDANGDVLGYQARSTSADAYSGRISWFDEFHVEEIQSLFAGWLARADDAFWNAVLRRAIGMCVAANNASPLEVAIPVALSCLELLAWAVLEVDSGWLDQRDGHLNLTGRLRLLLRWAGIDPAIPSQLGTLTKLAASDSNIPDGPAAIAWVRNRSVHPPKLSKTGEPGWATPEQLHHAWRLAMEYSELVILRLLGYNGAYGSRLHLEGRHWGTVKRVPWSQD